MGATTCRRQCFLVHLWEGEPPLVGGLVVFVKTRVFFIVWILLGLIPL